MAVTAYLKSSRLRVANRRHPWVYANSVERIEGTYENGDVLVARDQRGKFVAHAFVNDGSRIRLRLVSFSKKRPVDEALLRERAADAVRLRTDVLGLDARTDAYRLINSEGDHLPGLIVDRYGDVLIATCSVLGMQQRIDAVYDELEELLSPRAIVEISANEHLRGREGLPEGRGVVRGSLDAEEGRVTIDGLSLGVRYIGGQKTGLFLDQRDTVRRVAELSVGRRVLDACCYVGTFGLACAKAGASSVVLFDTSQPAVDRAQENAKVNGVEDRVEVRRGTLFRELRAMADAEELFDLIVLDPPKFATGAKDKNAARRGYLNANQLALRLLAPGGLLLTCSCSHHMSADNFEGMLRESATRTGVGIRLLELRGPGADHPMDLQCPEGRYLKAFLLQKS
jgi:23S rRNA (cytosine1962-C5)-methyltransferase